MICPVYRIFLIRVLGFSLLELLVCVCIVSILSTIALVGYQGSVDSSSIKTGISGVLSSLNYSNVAREKNEIITVEFLLGTSKIRVTRDSGSGEPKSKVINISSANLLKKKLGFRSYKWPDGATKPATFVFYPDSRPIGGIVTFGTPFAHADIYLQGDRVSSNLEI
jgi:prepilin-type N-terminal cleavage/methylation domain-containing protein